MREKIIPHPPTLLLLTLAALLLASCVGLPADEIELTSEAVKATDQLVMATYEALSTAMAVTTEAMIATATAEAQATPTPTVATIDLHLTISDGQSPLEAEIYLSWPDTGGDFGIGPTSDIVLPLPADGEPVEVTVEREG